MFVLSFYLYSMAVKDGCSMLTVEYNASEGHLTAELCIWIIIPFRFNES